MLCKMWGESDIHWGVRLPQGLLNDDTILHILVDIERELLPAGDDDDMALMQIEWHPTNTGSHVARTAH